jgi:hypothetical protein
MKKISQYLSLTLLFFVISIKIYAQNKEFKTIRFNYSFENITSENQIDLLKKDVEALKNVQLVKTIYKRDSGKGLLVVDVTEKINKREVEEGFDVTQLKKLIISNQLTPIELTQEEVLVKD